MVNNRVLTDCSDKEKVVYIFASCEKKKEKKKLSTLSCKVCVTLLISLFSQIRKNSATRFKSLF